MWSPRNVYWAAILLMSATTMPSFMARESVAAPVATRTKNNNRARLEYIAKPSRRCKGCGDEADTEVRKREGWI